MTNKERIVKMSRALYDLDTKDRRSIVSLVTSLYKRAGYRRVPLKKEEFVLIYTRNNMQDDIINMLLAKEINVECTAEDVYNLYDDVMR